MLKSNTYYEMFEELLEGIQETGVTQRDWINVDLVKSHLLQQFPPITTLEEKVRYARAYVTEMASQFREAEFLLRLQVKGSGAMVQIGFTTDISESCLWITPYILPPGNMSDVRSVVNLKFKLKLFYNHKN